MRSKRVAVFVAALVACSDPSDPCSGDGPNLGVPSFDVLGSLRARGAEVIERGERADVHGFSLPALVMSVDDEEVLRWEHCSGATYVRDVGLLGVGVEARDPPVIDLGPDDHLFTISRTLLWYAGQDSSLIQLLTDVLGPELGSN